MEKEITLPPIPLNLKCTWNSIPKEDKKEALKDWNRLIKQSRSFRILPDGSMIIYNDYDETTIIDKTMQQMRKEFFIQQKKENQRLVKLKAQISMGR